MSKILLGCIADDFTGATDLANNLVRSGMRVVQTIGVPLEPMDDEADAVVVALKSRTLAAADAVAQSCKLCNGCKRKGRLKFISSTAPLLTVRPLAILVPSPMR